MKYKFKPYSNNIIFLDTEFSSLDPYKGEILSIGLVKLGGEELYLELQHEGMMDPWVQENILPTLTQKKISRKLATEKINSFVGTNKPFAVSNINQFDALYIYKLFGVDKHPFFWIPIDFASILFSLGIDPESYSPENKESFAKQLGIDISKFHIHHALDDAKLLREVYLKMTTG